MIVSGFEGTHLNSQTEELITEKGIGGLILFERNYEHKWRTTVDTRNKLY